MSETLDIGVLVLSMGVSIELLFLSMGVSIELLVFGVSWEVLDGGGVSGDVLAGGHLSGLEIDVRRLSKWNKFLIS